MKNRYRWFRFKTFMFFYHILAKIDWWMIDWGKEATPYLRKLGDERMIYVGEMIELEKQYGRNWYKYQLEESFQRWLWINDEWNRLYPPRYIDIRKVFTFLYHSSEDRRAMSREERLREDSRMSDEIREILAEERKKNS